MTIKDKNIIFVYSSSRMAMMVIVAEVIKAAALNIYRELTESRL